jgi:hypothetical protein
LDGWLCPINKLPLRSFFLAMKRSSLFLSPDPISGAGGNPSAVPGQPVNTPPAPTPPASGAPPPAAAVVLNSDVREEDAAELVRLRRDNEDLGKKKREVETRVSELEDENRRLKTIPAPPAALEKKGFLEGATFFD